MPEPHRTAVINLRGRRGHPHYDPALNPQVVYCGRAVWWGPGRRLPGHVLANPFSVRTYGRDEALARYRVWLPTVPDLDRILDELRGKTLACWCEPDPCHCHIIAELRATR